MVEDITFGLQYLLPLPQNTMATKPNTEVSKAVFIQPVNAFLLFLCNPCIVER